MKKLYYISHLILSLPLFVNTSCAQNSHDKPIEIEQLTSEVFMNEEELQTPMSLTATDKGLAIVNTNKTDNLIDVYDKTGKLRSSFLVKGEGPKEAMRISNIQYIEKDKSLCAMDSYRNTILNMTGSIENGYEVEPTLTLKKNTNDNALDVSSGIIYTNAFGQLANGNIIVSNGTVAGMLAIVNGNGDLIKTIVPYPDKNLVNEQLTDWANIQLYYPYIRVSPNGKFAVAAYTEADVRTFMNIDKDSVAYNVYIDSYPNDLYIQESGPDFVQAFYTSESYSYTQDLSLSNNYAYQLYIGLKQNEIRELDIYKDTRRSSSNTVKVFDKNGSLRRILNLDKWVQAIAVTPDDKYLYALGESSADGYYILKYEL